MHKPLLTSGELAALVQSVRHAFAMMGATRSMDIARLTGINQSQVHRNLFGVPKRRTRTLDRLCKYAETANHSPMPDPASSRILMQAVALVWDGSEDQARRIAEVLMAMKQARL